MASANIFDICTCDICIETFDESSKSPRILSCGHSFCYSCLVRLLLALNPCCPTCRAKISFQRPESIPINYSLKSLINFRSQILKPNTSANLGGFIDEAYKELRKQVSQKVEEELGQRKTRTDILTESLRELEEERKSLIEEIKRKELELKDREKRIQELESLKAEENKFCDKLRQLQTMVENSANDAEFSKFSIELEILLGEGKKQIKVDLSPSHLLQTREDLGTLGQSRPVYAVEDRFDGTRYGKVSLKDGRILVDSFQQEKPEDATLFALPELLSRFNNGSSELPKTVFLMVTPLFHFGGRSYPFEVIIETDGLTTRAKNCILLCSALKGPSYKGGGIEGGSTYWVTPLAPSSVVEGIREDEFWTKLKEKGVYGIEDGDSTFRIQLEDAQYETYSEPKFGVVVAGLQRLKDFVGKKCRLIIEECGLVI